MHIPPLWRISACAALLGLGQNGLLVVLPVLVEYFDLPLSQWAGLILMGSMLFLLGSPFWGQIADRYGARVVVIQALLGYVVSFGLIGFALWGAAKGLLSAGTLLIVVALARVLYGLTVSGMVPACQQWSLVLHGDEERIKALSAISAGLSAGRLLGPLGAAACLGFGIYTPFGLMMVLGLLALALLKGIPQPSISSSSTGAVALSRFTPGLLPYLAMALLLTMSVSLMQLGLPGALQGKLDIDAIRAGHLMGILLSLGAFGAFCAQLGVTRRHLVGGYTLLVLGAVGLVVGYGLLIQAASIAGLGVGVVVASIGAALAVPAYTDAVTRHQAQGTGAGFVAMAHTLGYGAATVAVSGVVERWLLPLAGVAASMLLILVPLARRHFKAETVPRISVSRD